jgi:hypothetical protein
LSAYGSNQREAQSAWISRYPFQPVGGGLGASLACTGSSSRVALVGTTPATGDASPNVAVITNKGTVFVHVLLGDGTVVATVSCMAVPPGGALTVSMFVEGTPVPTYIAGITDGAAATIQVSLGFGN